MSAAPLTEEQDKLLMEMRRLWDSAEQTHMRYRTNWDRLDALYHSRRDFLRAHSGASSDRDRRGVLDDARAEFGEDLLIPYAFSVVETVLPRMLSNRPRMLWTPKDQASEKNVENVKIVVDGQQQQCNYELKLQTTARSGLIYGLGIQKLVWRKDVRTSKALKKRLYLPGYSIKDQDVVLWDDPDVEDVSIYDARWDPYGDSMSTLGWMFHRSWRSTKYCMDKIESGAWPDVALTAEDLAGQNGLQWYQDSWKGRRDPSSGAVNPRDPIQEVWEFHDGERVVTVLNRLWPVAAASNPAWHGRMPFHIFRPTEWLHQFPGKGEIEPIEELSREMNEMRTDRRWNARMVMHKSYWYEDGTIDPKEVRIGPGTLNAVDGDGRPLSELLHPVMVGDIPNSGYQEEAALQADIERVSGISDPVSGVGGANQTATGVQLVQAAAGLRIQNKTRRIEIELIKSEAEDWLALNQQHIVETRQVGVAVPAPQPGVPGPVWQWVDIGPEQLSGRFAPEPDGGSTAPENVQQMRQDAQLLMQLLAAPGVDQRQVLMLVFEKLGMKAPEQYLAPETVVPPQTLDLILQQLVQQVGVDPAVAQDVIANALHAALDAQQQAQAPGVPPGQGNGPPQGGVTGDAPQAPPGHPQPAV